MSAILKFIGIISAIVGVLAIGEALGSVLGDPTEVMVGIACIISGVFSWGFATVIDLLTDIRDSLANTNNKIPASREEEM